MDREVLLKMDPNILVSMVNMKIKRFLFKFRQYCEDMDISRRIIDEKIRKCWI